MTSEQRFGFYAGMGAYVIWGLLPIYLKLIDHIAPADVLAHRIAWSVPMAFGLILFANRGQELKTVLRSKMMMWLTMSSVLIGLNWLVYIWAVANDRVLEASLGYYINPLLNVAIGAVFLSEKLRRIQWVAVAIAALAVIIETIALGRLPWAALILCFTFAAYSLIRKKVQVDSRVGFTVEVLLLLPLSMLWLAIAFSDGRNTVGNGGFDIGLLALAGPITAFPLILFAMAAKRLRFSTIGIMQYLGPSLQFIVALGFGETLTPLRVLTFALIWLAIIIFSVDAFMHERAERAKARP